MWAAKIMRLLRSKISFSIVLFFVVTYLLFIKIINNDEDDFLDTGTGHVRKPQEIRWDIKEEINDTIKVPTCRNSVQGKHLLADDQGFVCPRDDKMGSGCCNVSAENTSKRFSCNTCNHQGCCAIYEYCLSCCLSPNKTNPLKRMLNRIGHVSRIFSSVSDHFELCLVKCRTSSHSVLHETHYRDPKAKHCFLDISNPHKSNT